MANNQGKKKQKRNEGKTSSSNQSQDRGEKGGRARADESSSWGREDRTSDDFFDLGE